MRIALVLASLVALSCTDAQLATQPEPPPLFQVDREEVLQGTAAVKKAISVMSAELNDPRTLAGTAKILNESAADRRAHLVEAIEILESTLVDMNSNPSAAASSCAVGSGAELLVASTFVSIGYESVSLESFSLASRATSIDHSMFLEVSTNGPNYWDWTGSASTSCSTALYSDIEGEFTVQYGNSWIYYTYGETTHFLPGVTDWSRDSSEYAHTGETW